MKTKDEIKIEISENKQEQRKLQDEAELIDKNDYMALNNNHNQRSKLAARIDTLFWVLVEY